MKPISFRDTLVYHDGVEVFGAQDSIGGNYIGVMIESQSDRDQYLVAGVNPNRLNEFRAGDIDLKSLLLDTPDDQWYVTWTKGDFSRPLELTVGEGSICDSGYLPNDGFVLCETPRDDQPLLRAREENNLVFELRATPPETWNRHRIRMNTLGSLLLQMQMVLRHAYSNALKDVGSRARRRIDTTDGHLLDVVVPAAPGSFQIILEAVRRPDLLGFAELERGLQRMDDVFESASNPETARQGLRAYKGHLAGSYIKLMRFLADNESGLQYGWASPMSEATKYSGVSKTVARGLAESLAEDTSLGREDVELRGALERVNFGAGTWGLNTADGMKVGSVMEGGPNLSGLIIRKPYVFECEEVVDLDATGREVRTLYLKRIQEGS